MGAQLARLRDFEAYGERVGERVQLIHGPGDDPVAVGHPRVRQSSIVNFVKSVRREFDTSTFVHDNGLWTPWNLAVSSSLLRSGAKFGVSVHGMLEPWSLRQGRLKKTIAWHAYQRAILQSADIVFATADAETEAIRAQGIKGPIAMVPNGIELEPFVFTNRRDLEI